MKDYVLHMLFSRALHTAELCVGDSSLEHKRGKFNYTNSPF